MTTANEREPSEIELLLPWYAAGTLDAREAQQVEAALAGDPELARRFEWVRAEFAQETSINEMSGEPSTGDVKALFAKIDALPTPRQKAALNLGARFAEFLAALSPRTLAWSATAAALAIMLQAGLLAGILLEQAIPGGYETASAPTNVRREGTYVLMRFRSEATAADIAAFLSANKLSIVDGPAGGQLYQVRVAPTKLAKDDLMRVVQQLQDDKVVGFVAATN
ncbi:MAG TPA: zf-HC2 domain-containing protein [Xanthobacteraceae bacterium]|nr:zf-HC2 domain-containing protein [Xanthobacteraceae bacterium]